jgi:hypothetical protein
MVAMPNGGTGGTGGAGGGLTTAAGAAVVVLGALKSLGNNITYSFDTVSKDAQPRNDEACRGCQPQTKKAEVRVLKHDKLLGVRLFDNLRIRLNVYWEYNGCDVKGAIFSFGSCAARLGWEAEVTGTNLDTNATAASGCARCCERAACVKLHYSIKVKPPIQATRIYEGTVTVCGDGTATPEILT